jgi:hypothetical protein
VHRPEVSARGTPTGEQLLRERNRCSLARSARLLTSVPRREACNRSISALIKTPSTRKTSKRKSSFESPISNESTGGRWKRKQTSVPSAVSVSIVDFNVTRDPATSNKRVGMRHGELDRDDWLIYESERVNEMVMDLP